MHRYCTIVSANYLPQALTLAESFREVYPGVFLEVLVIDLKRGSITDHANVHYIFLEDLPIDSSQVRKMRTYYDVVEFATALKPTLLLHLLEDSDKTVSYIDPDIYLFSEISQAQEMAEEQGLAITPHRITGMPLIPKSPQELSFLRVGIYNLGFICVGKKADQILRWWEARLRWHATQFDALPYFTDQKWADFFPTFVDGGILRNLGYNLAFWNLDERPLMVNNDGIFAGEEKLVFVHFSQMSSELMKFGKSILWATWLEGVEYDSHSVSVIEKLSRNYGEKLNQSAAKVKTFALTPEFSFSPRGRFARAKMIRKDIAGKDFSARLTFSKVLMTPKLLNKLEKSSAISGLRIGLLRDLSKIQKRLNRE